MKEKIERLTYSLSTGILGLLGMLFLLVLITSFTENLVVMYVGAGWNWGVKGNYVGLFVGFIAYGLFMISMIIPRVRHNLDWFMKFTHELTHTLVAVLFFAKIREFVVRDRECYVNYKAGPIGFVPITLAPYCIPIYTLMLFPFRFAGENQYMIFFDFLIAFTYAFHVHAFIKQTRATQPDIEGCGLARSAAFITFIHMCILALIFATPRGGVLNAISRVFWEYPMTILTDPAGWLHYVIRHF